MGEILLVISMNQEGRGYYNNLLNTICVLQSDVCPPYVLHMVLDGFNLGQNHLTSFYLKNSTGAIGEVAGRPKDGCSLQSAE